MVVDYMPKTVIKKDGGKESFIKEKIVVSAVKSGAPLKIARDIADKIDKHPKDEIKTSEIRKSVLDELTLHNPDLPKRWLSYDKSVKRLYKHMY
jgi:transcriptional regulator NrdR family protein